MNRRTLKLFILMVSASVLLLMTAASALGAVGGPIQQTTSDSGPVDANDIEAFWHELYPGSVNIASASNVYTHELLAKAEPDECFNGLYEPITELSDCDDGQPKVNEAYVWGMTDYQDTIWFGTAPNVHCLVIGGYMGVTTPFQTDSYVCELEAGPYAPLNDAIGDWRPPSLYFYDNQSKTLTEVTPNGETGIEADPRINQTLGIRSATTYGDYVIFAGPAFSPISLNFFVFNAATQTYVGSYNLPGYNNIRKWLEVDGVLYTAVGKPGGGAVLRYRGDLTDGDPSNDMNFEVVGELTEDGAELALHDGRLFVNTWPSNFGGNVAGLWMSPVIPEGGLDASHAGDWTKVFSYDEYEPDPSVASTYGGGALYSYQGDLYWGTMHVPGLATMIHFLTYGMDYIADAEDLEQIELALTGNIRAISIFRGRNFGEVDEEIEVLYGFSQVPVFDPGSKTWSISDTLLGPPLYGAAGFDSMHNNYTWAMAEYDGQLFVGTMDWSYLVNDIFDTLINYIRQEIEEYIGELPLDIELDISLPDSEPGADLYRFFASDQPAIAESTTGVGNYTSYGVRNLLGREEGLYLGMANPMNLLTDLTDDKPEGGWELIRLTRHAIPLNVSLGGNGTGTVTSEPAGIDCGATCSASFDYGTTITLTPIAGVGSTFAGWSNVCFDLGPCAVDLREETSLTANFVLEQHTLSVSLAGDGSGSVISDPAGINCGTACESTYDYGTTVILTPTADAGSVFTGWTGACTGTGTCEVTITESRQVTATFANNRFPLVVNIVGGGSGLVKSTPDGLTCSQASCSAVFDNGTEVSLSAIAFSGSSFASWGGACTGTDTCLVTIAPGTTVVTATFDNNPQNANLEVSGDMIVGAQLYFTATLNLNPITECTWDFGDGTTEPCELPAGAADADAVHDVSINATHVYTQPGIYIVIVTASNDAGTTLAARQVTIQVPTGEEPSDQPDADNKIFFPFLNRN